MSLTGKGHTEFDDGLHDAAGSTPRKGVVDFGDDESPEIPRTRNVDHRRIEQDSSSGGKARFADQDPYQSTNDASVILKSSVRSDGRSLANPGCDYTYDTYANAYDAGQKLDCCRVFCIYTASPNLPKLMTV